MKLKTTIVLAAVGVAVSAAGAFAIPVAKTAATPDPAVWTEAGGTSAPRDPSRITAGDTLQLDARLGHASIAKNARGETYLFAQVTAADDKTSATTAPPLNLGIVVDRSGSMKGERIANAMTAAVGAVERMRDGDSVTVVSFDDTPQVVVPPTRVSAGTRPQIEAAIRSIRLGGDTCISCGLQEGMRQLARAPLGSDRVNRMILLSDGAANVGVKDVAGIRAMAGRMHGKGVTISTIGVDVDFDEKIMAAIAAEANGKHHFVANASALPNVFSQEFDDLLASVAKEAELAIDLAPGVEVAEVFDRSFRREGNKILVPFGTFSASQDKTVLVKLRVPTDRDGSQAVAGVKLAYRDLAKKTDGACGGDLALLVKADGSEQKDLDPFVAARLERSRTAATLTEANELFESGRVSEARAKLAGRKADLAKTESKALALAHSGPFAPPPRAARPLDRDFDTQRGALDAAEKNFAPPPPSKGGVARSDPFGGAATGTPAVAAPATREGKASVRANQQQASEFGF